MLIREYYAGGRGFKNFKIQGSNDSTNGKDGTWTDLAVGLSCSGEERWNVFNFDNTQAYETIRITGESLESSGCVSIGEIQMMETHGITAKINNPYGKDPTISNVGKYDTGIYGDLLDIVSCLNGELQWQDSEKKHAHIRIYNKWGNYDLSLAVEGETVNAEIHKDSIDGEVLDYTFGVIRNGRIVANVKKLAQLAGAALITETEDGIVVDLQGSGTDEVKNSKVRIISNQDILFPSEATSWKYVGRYMNDIRLKNKLLSLPLPPIGVMPLDSDEIDALNRSNANLMLNLTQDQIAQLFKIDPYGIVDYMQSKSVEYKNEVFKKILNRNPDNYRHKWSWGEAWAKIPDSESPDYNFWKGDIISESEMLFGSNRITLDAQVITKVVAEVAIAYLGGVIIEEFATFYLAISAEGLTGAIELYRTGRLMEQVAFYKELTALRNIGSLNEELLAGSINAFTKAEEGTVYQIEVIADNGNIITKAIAEAMETLAKAGIDSDDLLRWGVISDKDITKFAEFIKQGLTPHRDMFFYEWFNRSTFKFNELENLGIKTYSDLNKALIDFERMGDDFLEHIFKGQLKKNESGVEHLSGYHYEGYPNAVAKVKSITTQPNSLGIYEAEIESISNGVVKTVGSTFFPKDWTPKQVQDAIMEAYWSRQPLANGWWQGTSNGMKIRMGIQNGPFGMPQIVTAFPVF